MGEKLEIAPHGGRHLYRGQGNHRKNVCPGRKAHYGSIHVSLFKASRLTACRRSARLVLSFTLSSFRPTELIDCYLKNARPLGGGNDHRSPASAPLSGATLDARVSRTCPSALRICEEE